MILVHREFGITQQVKLLDQTARFFVVMAPGLEQRGPYVLEKSKWRRGNE